MFFKKEPNNLYTCEHNNTTSIQTEPLHPTFTLVDIIQPHYYFFPISRTWKWIQYNAGRGKGEDRQNLRKATLEFSVTRLKQDGGVAVKPTFIPLYTHPFCHPSTPFHPSPSSLTLISLSSSLLTRSSLLSSYSFLVFSLTFPQ